VIFVDTNVLSESLRKSPEPAVIASLVRHDSDLLVSTIVIGEGAYGIQKFHPDQRAVRLQSGLDEWRRRYADRIFGFTEASAIAYGEIMATASRKGRPMTASDGMIAAIARVHSGQLATRNIKDFETTGLDLVSPWDF
jgi:predicted nucleic acid-binding protein